MEKITSDERALLNSFLDLPIPEFIKEFSGGGFDLMDCYEIGFMYAKELLRGKKINPALSPWGDGKSLIFEPEYSMLLMDVLRYSQSKDVYNYCQIYLALLKVLKKHCV